MIVTCGESTSSEWGGHTMTWLTSSTCQKRICCWISWRDTWRDAFTRTPVRIHSNTETHKQILILNSCTHANVHTFQHIHIILPKRRVKREIDREMKEREGEVKVRRECVCGRCDCLFLDQVIFSWVWIRIRDSLFMEKTPQYGLLSFLPLFWERTSSTPIFLIFKG